MNGANMKKDWVEEVGEKKMAAVWVVQVEPQAAQARDERNNYEYETYTNVTLAFAWCCVLQRCDLQGFA